MSNIINNKFIYQSKYRKDNDNLVEYELRILNMQHTMANTIGNLFRRIILTRLPGTAISGFKIENMKHSFDYLYEIDKDANTIGLNLSQSIFYYNSNFDESIGYSCTISGAKTITLGSLIDILNKENKTSFQAINRDLVLFSIVKNVKLKITLLFMNSQGFIPCCDHRLEDDFIAINSIFTHSSSVYFVSEQQNSMYNKNEDFKLNFNLYDVYNVSKDPDFVIHFILQELSLLISKIKDAIQVFRSTDIIKDEIMDLFNEVQPEILKYLQEFNVNLNSIEEIIDSIKSIPDKYVVDDVKIKKKEIQSILKMLNKLQKKNKY